MTRPKYTRRKKASLSSETSRSLLQEKETSARKKLIRQNSSLDDEQYTDDSVRSNVLVDAGRDFSLKTTACDSVSLSDHTTLSPVINFDSKHSSKTYKSKRLTRPSICFGILTLVNLQFLSQKSANHWQQRRFLDSQRHRWKFTTRLNCINLLTVLRYSMTTVTSNVGRKQRKTTVIPFSRPPQQSHYAVMSRRCRQCTYQKQICAVRSNFWQILMKNLTIRRLSLRWKKTNVMVTVHSNGNDSTLDEVILLSPFPETPTTSVRPNSVKKTFQVESSNLKINKPDALEPANLRCSSSITLNKVESLFRNLEMNENEMKKRCKVQPSNTDLNVVADSGLVEPASLKLDSNRDSVCMKRDEAEQKHKVETTVVRRLLKSPKKVAKENIKFCL